MSLFGFGITQSDEFGEIYDQFMTEYNRNREVADITAEILADYHKEFADSDGVMHDVYFALAKAEWMCCAQSELVLRRVKEIIDSGDNLAFLRELGANESDLRQRAKKLGEFWLSLQTPRAKPRQRKVNPQDRIKDLPPVEVGECYAYKYENGYRIFVVLDLFQMIWTQTLALCCVLKPTYSAEQLKTVDVLQQDVAHIGGYVGVDFLSPSTLRKIGKLELPPHLKDTMFGKNRLIFGNKRDFRADYSEVETRPLSEWLEFRMTQQSDSSELQYNDEFQYYEDPREDEE
jgi:hypothetical protein